MASMVTPVKRYRTQLRKATVLFGRQLCTDLSIDKDYVTAIAGGSSDPFKRQMAALRMEGTVAAWFNTLVERLILSDEQAERCSTAKALGEACAVQFNVYRCLFSLRGASFGILPKDLGLLAMQAMTLNQPKVLKGAATLFEQVFALHDVSTFDLVFRYASFVIGLSEKFPDTDDWRRLRVYLGALPQLPELDQLSACVLDDNCRPEAIDAALDLHSYHCRDVVGNEYVGPAWPLFPLAVTAFNRTRVMAGLDECITDHWLFFSPTARLNGFEGSLSIDPDAHPSRALAAVADRFSERLGIHLVSLVLITQVFSRPMDAKEVGAGLFLMEHSGVDLVQWTFGEEAAISAEHCVDHFLPGFNALLDHAVALRMVQRNDHGQILATIHQLSGTIRPCFRKRATEVAEFAQRIGRHWHLDVLRTIRRLDVPPVQLVESAM